MRGEETLASPMLTSEAGPRCTFCHISLKTLLSTNLRWHNGS